MSISLLAGLSACVAIPIQMPDEKPFEQERLDFITIGQSTKNDIASAMANYIVETDEGPVSVNLTPSKYRDGDWWLYVQRREALEMAFLMVAAGPYGGGGGAGTIGGNDYWALLVKFDKAGVVSDYEVSRLNPHGCNREGICRGAQVYGLLASEAESQAAKQSELSPDHCDLFFYGRPRFFEQPVPVEVWLDGQRAGWLIYKNDFFHWRVKSGPRQLFVRDELLPGDRKLFDARDSSRQSFQFQCVGSTAHFIEQSHERQSSGMLRARNVFLTLHERDSAEGQKALRKRNLLLSNWSQPETFDYLDRPPDFQLGDFEIAGSGYQDLILRFGPPDVEAPDVGLVTYILDASQWFDLIGRVNSTFVAGQKYLLFIRLDSERKATGYLVRKIDTIVDGSVSYSTWSGTKELSEHLKPSIYCLADGYCVGPNNEYARFAPVEESKDAKRARAGDGECVINIFSRTATNAWRIKLNDLPAGYIHDAVWPSGFLQWRLPTGEYVMTAESIIAPIGQKPVVDSMTFKCRSAWRYYLQLEFSRRDGINMNLIEKGLGKLALDHRELIGTNP